MTLPLAATRVRRKINKLAGESPHFPHPEKLKLSSKHFKNPLVIDFIAKHGSCEGERMSWMDRQLARINHLENSPPAPLLVAVQMNLEDWIAEYLAEVD